MSEKVSRFNFRHDLPFMEAVDNWRAAQRPIVTRAEAIRRLALRGIAAEKYLATILENSLERLWAGGIFGPGADRHNFERFQQFAIQGLDAAVGLRFPKDEDLADWQGALGLPSLGEAQEKHETQTAVPRKQPSSR